MQQDVALTAHVVARRLSCDKWFDDHLTYEHEGTPGLYYLPEILSCCDVSVSGTLIGIDVWTITSQGILPIQIEMTQATCSLCSRVHYFDGRRYGLVNFENRYVIDIGNLCHVISAVFAELMQLKLDGGLATSAWWKSKTEQSLEVWLAKGRCEAAGVADLRKRFNALSSKLTSFLGEYLMKLVNIPANLFACCENPSIISMDGIVLSVEQNRIRNANLSSPWLMEQSSRHRATTRLQRNILQTTLKYVRDLIYAFATNGITHEELLKLELNLDSALFELIILAQTEIGSKLASNEHLRPFFRSCSKQIFPAAHYMPPSVWRIAEEVWKTRVVSINDYHYTAINAPMFAQFLRFMMIQQNTNGIDTVYSYTNASVFNSSSSSTTYPKILIRIIPKSRIQSLWTSSNIISTWTS